MRTGLIAFQNGPNSNDNGTMPTQSQTKKMPKNGLMTLSTPKTATTAV